MLTSRSGRTSDGEVPMTWYAAVDSRIEPPMLDRRPEYT